jgi:hypothetical protein
VVGASGVEVVGGRGPSIGCGRCVPQDIPRCVPRCVPQDIPWGVPRGWSVPWGVPQRVRRSVPWGAPPLVLEGRFPLCERGWADLGGSISELGSAALT